MSSASKRAILSRLELRSPPLPQTLIEAMDLMGQPEQLEVDPVTEMVQRDPIVVARLLQIVNSAYYGLQRSVSSADRAVVMLGPVAVTGIVMGMNMLKLRSALEGPASHCFIKLIRHSIATAFLTRHLLEGPPRNLPQAGRQRLGRIGVSFTAGLLHDFGKIILVYNYPDKAAELYDHQTIDRQVRDTDLRHLEQLLFGYDHTEAGEYVARKLEFPDVLTDVIRFHHEPLASSGNPDTDRIVRATAGANLISKTMGYGFSQTISKADCAENPIWDVILTEDLPQYPDRETLFTELRTQKEHLDQYVQNLTTTALTDAYARHKNRFQQSSFKSDGI